ncbi:MAG TPA: FAD-dependent oxidoreductase [Streptosporangiaceae bacterium]|nr:FAD-dependent oxidoreductase [Streptosporangiaceae bacterium]
MSTGSPDVFVIGAGVTGLTTALVLLEAGLSVTNYSAEPPHRTTSAAAGALWGAHLVGADERVGRWGIQTLNRFRELAADSATGVRELNGLAALLGNHADPPEYAAGLHGLTAADPATLPAGYGTGWRYRAPVITMAAYLDYLVDRLIAGGGLLQIGRPLRDLADASAQSAAPVIVNCAGYGAKTLVADAALTAVRGQVVVVANPGLTEFFVGDRNLPREITYMFPHGETALLGGTEVEGDMNTEPDPETAAHILRCCAEVEPRLADVPVLAHRVGLRPVRPQVRLEREALTGDRHVVHNYGHGGAGVTLSWGCAMSVRDEVRALLG